MVLFYHLPKTIGAISLFILIWLFSGSIILPTIVIGIFIITMVLIKEHKANILKEQQHKRDELKKEQQLKWDIVSKKHKARKLIKVARLAKIGIYSHNKLFTLKDEVIYKLELTYNTNTKRLNAIGVYRGHKSYYVYNEDLIKTLENIYRLIGKV